MNISQTAKSTALIFPAAKQAAKALKPSYKTACRIAFCINLFLVSAFLASFPLLRIAEAKRPAIPPDAPEVVRAIFANAGESCLYYNRILQARKAAGKPQRILQIWKHSRYRAFASSSQKFQSAHQSWRFDW